MQQQASNYKQFHYPEFVFETSIYPSVDIASFNWPVLKTQLVHQWPEITDVDMELAGQSRRRIALLIESKYSIPAPLVENYLRNFEQTIHKRLSFMTAR